MTETFTASNGIRVATETEESENTEDIDRLIEQVARHYEEERK